MQLTGQELGALDGGNYRIGIFFRLDTRPIVRAWLGVGKVEPGSDVVDVDGQAVYIGFGQVVKIPTFQQLTGGAADRVEFTLSGISRSILDAAARDVDAVRHCDCLLGYAIMGADWRLLAPIHWTFRGTADYLRQTVTPAGDETQQMTYSATLSVGTALTGRRRGGYSYWTDQDQQRRSPGDKFCERTILISNLAVKEWPRY